MKSVSDLNKIAFLLPDFNDGGVEKVTINLALGLMKRGYHVEFVCFNKKGNFLPEIPQSIDVHELKVKRAIESIPKLAAYLKREKPSVLISAKHYINTSALIANRLSGGKTKVIVTGHGMYNQNQKLLTFMMRTLYPSANAVVAVSEGVAENISTSANLRPDKIEVIHNPVINEEFINKYVTASPIEKSANEKLIVAAGRLSPEKDYQTLIQAFALLEKSLNARLIIIGEGPEREKLQKLIKIYHIDGRVELPGFASNPLNYIKAADVFVLSSLTEGLPTVLIEALYCDISIVSTDCPSGPREILKDGAYGTLVPVGDENMLAKGMKKALVEDKSIGLQKRALDFTSDKAIDAYEKLILSLTK